jgi:hypothetical protein
MQSNSKAGSELHRPMPEATEPLQSGFAMSTTWENFFAATAILASAGPIKPRLVAAYCSHLANLHEDDLPKEIREEFCSLSSCMCRVRPQRGETAEQATVRKMSDLEAGRVAMRIVNMLGVITKTQAVQRMPKLRAVNDD